MITGEIKLYDEPVPYSQSSYTVQVKPETPEQREEWLKRCASDLATAKLIFAIGDQIATKTASGSLLTVMSFIENLDDMQKYQGQPCIIKCKNMSYAAANEIQYSFSELNIDSLVKKDPPNV